MNFLVKDYSFRYNQMIDIVMWQLSEHFEEEQIVRIVQRANPLLEEFCIKKDENLIHLAEISVEETRPLIYTIVARFDRENINAYGGKE